MRVCILGDIHGAYPVINQAPKGTELVIQVGDFGFTHLHNPLAYTLDYKVYFCAGNHDSIEQLKFMSDDETKFGCFSEKLWYVPRGWVELIGNTLVGFFGGADTPGYDRVRRVPEVDWFKQEAIELSDVYRLKENLAAWNRVYNPKGWRDLDVLIVHVPPTSIVRKLVEPVYETGSSDLVEMVVHEFKPKRVFAGHMHQSYRDVIGNTRIIGLAENEMFVEDF